MSALAKIRNWALLFSEYATGQVAIQLLGFVAGLWLINLLPIREYALYTFALSMLTFLSVFSDMGVTGALLYFRRQPLSTESGFVKYVRAALAIRYGLVIAGALGGSAFMVTLGIDRGFAVWEVVFTGAILLAAVWAQVGSSITIAQLRLDGFFRESYVAEACGNAARVLAVATMAALSVPWAEFAMLSGAIGPMVVKLTASRLMVRRRAAPTPAAGAADFNREEVGAIVRFLLPTIPSSIYFAAQAPLIVWLSAYFAGTITVAEVGALGRLGLIFGFVSGFVSAVALPRLAGMVDDNLYLRRYLQSWVLLAAFGIAVMALALAVPDWFLLLLGSRYAGLGNAVAIIAASAVLTAWGGYLVGVNNARGWVRLQPAVLVIYAVTQACLIATLDLSTTMGVLLFGVWSSLAGLSLQLAVNVTGFLKPAWVAVRK